MQDNKLIALLPMKRNSERVKNKNIKLFCGKPLFYYVLRTLHKSKYISEIFIDTDSKQIADCVREFYDDVHIIRRKEELCGDYVSMNDIIAYDISYIGEEFFIQTHATNPLLQERTIDKAFCCFSEKYKNGDVDSLFSVNELHSRLYDSDGKPINHNANELLRTQDLKAIYEENSNMYIFSKESFKKNMTRIGEKPLLYPMNKIEAMDIDTETDFKLAEYIYQVEHKGEN